MNLSDSDSVEHLKKFKKMKNQSKIHTSRKNELTHWVLFFLEKYFCLLLNKLNTKLVVQGLRLGLDALRDIYILGSTKSAFAIFRHVQFLKGCQR